MVAIEFSALELDRIRRILDEPDSPAMMQEGDPLGLVGLARGIGRYRIECRDLTGFDVVLEQRIENAFG